MDAILYADTVPARLDAERLHRLDIEAVRVRLQFPPNSDRRSYTTWAAWTAG